MDSQPAVKKKKLNIKKEIFKYLRYWYWILLSMLLFYLGAKIYLRYTTPQYLSRTTLQFPHSKTKGGVALTDLTTLGNGLGGDSELQGEATAILSKPTLAKVVGQLNLNVSFFGVGAIKENELYTSSPLLGNIINISDPNFSSASYVVAPSGKNTYKLSEGPLIKGKNTFNFGEIVKLPLGTVVLSLKPGKKSFEPVKVIFRSTPSIVSSLEKSVTVTLPPNKGLMMELSLIGPVPGKSESILNSITEQYKEDGVKDRNAEAQNTQDFINGRLEIISEDLSGIEGEKESFKRKNEITDLDTQANIAVNNTNSGTKQIVAYSTQLELIKSIYDASSVERLLPSNMGLSGVTEGYLAKYNDMLLTKSKTLKQATSQNPSIIILNRDINEMRNLIRQNLMESKATLQLQIAQLQAQLNSDRTKIYNYPTQEKIFRGIERQQNLKEQLYLYLLQKREENAITLAVTAPIAKVLNPAYTIGVVKPEREQIVLGALLAGLLLPIVVIFAKNAADNKVHTKDQVISHIPNASVIAEIPIKDNDLGLLQNNDFTVFAESFRILSSNLKFILRTKENGSKGGVILVTSSIKGEGKSTISVNTALTLAGSSKVLLIGADIRNPQLHRFIKDSKKGLTDYLISEDEYPDQYIVPSGLHQNLDVLFSGAIAPNPNDLLDMKKFGWMMETLRNEYQYIILDSAPVMLVSDTLHLMEKSDIVLYIIKSNYTDIPMLDFADEFQQSHSVNNISFVLNNVKPEDSRYGSKYGYGYYTHKGKK
ncbi:polysaccharide biosynthesis tyrosine autokinase [Epilithonimonas sp. JDS]|uniref:exopolysaccharide transport family protein n=1 Tax=Epilithonimonas sp. JDS TaxID=2902797 RepID=UPI001E4BE499|nr:polysaccharide biosynthesis tyrosine autokinase [Epilithonimonas sp. JDS]MCD9853825.1 polysaccharide biosynthesis tyrosine autokinase [Epilithonimonas sp. JDS]